ncbi:glycosyltransferase involved in cell wall biosynthesis [Dysgonomonas hofstadii]|uniref:Glycosyltransferase involved in cell wall biosynthesis n=1 Tax=Dysgonomonas hofstadii TaxID=637886 RepID=A0A840CUJ1_9BACT|nr:glycosyltransferase family 4 protein [Dysgonomonas hofstadii]MBB4037354.1 glycosyltransferase involved in cell wall biosynthesis [Dysgonomonas hofstadii]
MNRIKICYLVSSLSNEGPVNVMYNIIKYINLEKFDVSIITLIPEKENSRFKEFKKLPVVIHQLSADFKLNLLKLFYLLKDKVSEVNPDILHSHCPRSLYLMKFLSSEYKKTYTIHIYPGQQQIVLYGKLLGNIVIRLNNFFTKRIDLPIGCAESVSELYKINQGWNITNIPNGTDLPLWKKDLEYRQVLRKELGLKQDIKYFIFIGRFSKEKNPDILFNVFKHYLRSDIGLIMLGNGPMWDNLKNEECDNIIMPGFTTRVYDYLKVADYYISTSDTEGLANTLLESMTVGLPMLLSDIPSHHEILRNFEHNEVGMIIDQHNVESIKKGIDFIGELDHDKVCQSVQHLFLEKYTAKRMSEQYQYEYSKVLNQ